MQARRPSPVFNLAAIGRLELVRELFGSILIPPAVRTELGRNHMPSVWPVVESALADGSIRVAPLSGPVPEDFIARVDTGEAEALAMAR